MRVVLPYATRIVMCHKIVAHVALGFETLYFVSCGNQNYQISLSCIVSPIFPLFSVQKSQSLQSPSSWLKLGLLPTCHYVFDPHILCNVCYIFTALCELEQ